MNKQIIMLNASAMKLSSCDRRLWLTIVDGYTNKSNSNDIEYGSAFHRFAAHYSNHGPTELVPAMHQGIEYFKNTPMHIKKKKEWLNVMHLQRTMMGYHMLRMAEPVNAKYEVLRNPITNTPAIELKFMVPLYEDDELVIMLCGTIDQVVRLSSGLVCLLDFKTTSSYDHADYLDVYRLSAQLLTYIYGLLWYMDQFPQFKELIGNRGLGAFIEGVFLHPQNETVFRRGDIFVYKPEQIMIFKEMMMELVARIVKLFYSHKGGYAIKPNGILNDSCQTKFGKCPFFHACASGDSMQQMLDNHFVKRIYNPLEFQA